jgi:hypothetical protein
MKTGARISRKQTGESIPSLKLTRYGRLLGSHYKGFPNLASSIHPGLLAPTEN